MSALSFSEISESPPRAQLFSLASNVVICSAVVIVVVVDVVGGGGGGGGGGDAVVIVVVVVSEGAVHFSGQKKYRKNSA